MIVTGRRVALSLLVVAGAVVFTSCVDERVVFRDRPIYLDPSPEALDFLGYANPARTESQLTVCGQCHVGQQSQWEGTAHATAWAGMQSAGNVQTLCHGCHSVTSLGNVAGENGAAVGGYVAVNDVRYHDVQCESCHGPGLPHVRNPSDHSATPLAPITVGTDLTFGCGQCHNAFHHPFVEEWSQSAHGNVTPYAATRRDDLGGCWSCHSGEGALRKFGVRANYLEREALLEQGQGHANITCAVCHDPHSNEFAGQLRFPSNTGSVEEHICAQCHNRAVVPTVGVRGLAVHAPEAPLLDGTLHSVGWIPPGMELDVDQIRGSHAGQANPRLCSTCHVVPFEVHDPAANRTFLSSGHRFQPIPCVDANGIPTGATNCPISATARDWRGCTNGCHGDATAAAAVTNSALATTLTFARDLYRMLRQIDPNLAAPGGPIDPTNPQFTVAEGAYFNLQLAHHGTPVHDPNYNVSRADSLRAFMPSTVHNPFLTRALLIWSIEAVRNTYGVAPAAGFNAASLLQDIPHK
jgi:predicted CXXCH cytochrome family protein